jgi:alpha-mannosidase
VIYKDAQDEYDQVRHVTNEANSNSFRTINARIDTKTAGTPGSVPLLIMNPLGWKRSGLVEADVQLPAATSAGVSVVGVEGHVLPSMVLSSDPKTNSYRLLIQASDIPSLGYHVAHVVPGRRAFTSDLKVSGRRWRTHR